MVKYLLEREALQAKPLFQSLQRTQKVRSIKFVFCDDIQRSVVSDVFIVINVGVLDLPLVETYYEKIAKGR